MRIAVIADTHVPQKFETLSRRMLKNLQGVDFILHCGDIVEPYVIEELQKIAPVEAVAGNHDIERFGESFPRKKVVSFKGIKIGMIHGDDLENLHVSRSELMNSVEKVVLYPFLTGEPVDIIVFGHCHQPILETIRAEFYPFGRPSLKTKRSVILFNPGMPISNKLISSIGFIKLDDNSFNIELKVFAKITE